MRNLILYVATSLDGYLADPQGNIDWLTPPSEEDDSYLQFYQSIDTILMGNTTYQQIVTDLSPDFWPYDEKKTFVFSHSHQEDKENISFTQRSPKELLNWLKHRKGGDIWLCGGANLVAQCLEEQLVHRIHLTLMPLLLGEGIPLFPNTPQRNHFTLRSATQNGEAVEVVYEKIP